LTDNVGKSYRLKDFGPGEEVVGRTSRASISPAKSADDVLVFEAPKTPILFLRLELPCAAFGAKGSVKLEVPGRWIANLGTTSQAS
jgi:hypothetical protein